MRDPFLIHKIISAAIYCYRPWDKPSKEGIMTLQPNMKFTGEENAALSYLTDRLSGEVKKTAALYGGMINEIRLRKNGQMSLTIRGQNIPCRSLPSDTELEEVFMRICKNSPYSYTDSMKDGFITTSEGIRVGICGRAVCENGVITAVSGISSICIRIPRRVPGAGDVAHNLLREMNYSKGLIVWSLPGVGKTTLLRELAVRLSSVADPLRVAVIDTRHEICAGLNSGMIDVLDGYPRSKGIEIAKRTLSPQIIICDEISTEDDATAILDAAGSGIPTVATAHSGSKAELLSQRHLIKIIESGYIGAYVGLLGQTFGGYKYDVFRCYNNTELCFER